ncbi:MAG: hypothetical protein KGL39_52100 [Patescibacteria group bacterium]|nr:hypothetical protein [Patescibacteria group bacterium]
MKPQTAEIKNPDCPICGQRIQVTPHPFFARGWVTSDGRVYYTQELVFLPAEDYDPDTVAEISRYYADKEFNGD